MKWIFECRAAAEQYLHARCDLRRKDFCSHGPSQGDLKSQLRLGSDPNSLESRAVPPAMQRAILTLSVEPQNQSAISLTTEGTILTLDTASTGTIVQRGLKRKQ
jgi:hypothetical protein